MFPLALLNSLSQIFFKAHAAAGLLMLAAFVVYDWRMALFVLLGAASSMAAARLAGARRDEVRAGVHGFCGALVGAAAFSSLGVGFAAVAAALLGGIACIPVTWLLARLFGSRPLRGFKLPTTTAPFCIVAGILLVLTQPLHRQTPALQAASGESTSRFLHATLSNVAQVVLVDSALAGLLILIALFLAHWKVGLAALLGAGLEVVFSLWLGEPRALIYHGIEGYSGVLVAVALAAAYLSGTWQPWVMALLGTVLVVPVGMAVGATGVPLYTWPFVLTTWIMLVIAKFIPGLQRA